MKSKTVTLMFIFAIAVIGIAFLATNVFFNYREKTMTRAKIVTPKSSSNSDAETEVERQSYETEKYETFVPLYSGETLISTLTMDINNDGYDDEVIVIRQSNSQSLWIVPALLEPKTGTFKRLTPIDTKFTKTRTFSYSGMDVTGEHKKALIYHGVADDGNYVMKIYYFVAGNGKNDMELIGDFESDGTVFIQQTERSEAYELALSKGESFSVWVYKSDKAETDGNSEDTKKINQNQIQQEYRWNPSAQKYELYRQIRVNADRLAETALSKIQDGTIETFAKFLDGLWYKTDNTDGNIRYLYFNYDDRQIIQLYKDYQEVYEWEDGKLRHNGIYISTTNADIMNLHRRFDVSVSSLDEIKVALRDDVNIIIKSDSLWNGKYKKLSLQSSFENEKDDVELATYNNEIKKAPLWTSSDSTVEVSFTDYNYTAKYNGIDETGVYSTGKAGAYNVIQFRSDGDASIFGEVYAMQFGTKTITETVKKQTVEKVVTDFDTVIFSPVKITPKDCFVTEGKVYTFTR